MARIVTVKLLIDAYGDAEAVDGVNEILREHLQAYHNSPNPSCLVDYALVGEEYYNMMPDYEEGEAFKDEPRICF